jgi:ubiquinone/menaquinone biosynthesis C-methylase UbiE
LIRSSLRLWRFLRAVFHTTTNLDTYQSEDVVNDYITRPEALQAPEASILSRIRPSLAGMAMLDLGVGVGRTSVFFKDLVRTYVGLDYSKPMIEICNERFSDPHVKFVVGDARELSIFESASFDFVQFSFNGLDLLNHEDRLRALGEMRRVCRPGGILCFSSHNLRAFHGTPGLAIFNRLPGWGPFSWIARFQRAAVSRVFNPSLRDLARRQFAVLNDGVLDYRLQTYYVAPSEQLSQLRREGLLECDLHGLDGRVISPDFADSSTDAWIYYLAFVGD